MYKRILIFFICLIPLLQHAQDFSALWKGHFSYNNIKEVVRGNNKIYAAAENAVFSYDTQTNEVKELNTVNGLSGETISTIYYSQTYELLVIGYENGLIEIAFDNDNKILTIVDIIDKPTITAANKKINHFNGYQNLIYISTNYGISVFNLDRLEFGDTYFIGDGGGQIPVNQSAINGGYIYAACTGGNGVRKALASSPNLIDYRNWQTIITGDFTAIETVVNNLYAVNTNRQLFQVVNDAFNVLFQYNTMPLKVKNAENNLIITTLDNVFIYDSNFTLISQIPINSEFNTSYTSATADTNFAYIGTADFGVLKTLISSPTSFEEIHPDGPLLNSPFSIKAETDGLWVTFGDYTIFYNPYPLDSHGISHLKSDTWINTPFSEVIDAKCLNAIAINPLKNNQVFISSFFNGMIEINDEVPTMLYNEQNSGLESLILPNDPSYIDIRVGASSFDNKGILWLTNGLINNHLKSYNPSNNQWKSYSLDAIIPKPFDNNGFADIVIGDDQTKWVAAGYSYGFIGFNESSGNTLIKGVYKEEEDNMPSTFVSALALDKRNQLWIGTYKGLRVLYNTSNFFESNEKVEEIIILEDGIAKELLFQQYITDIKVDGSNNKWIGTADSGLFYLSSDGQKTIYHFTKDNSPLPSNSIREVAIDDSKGIVYIATSKGLVSFKSGGSSPFDNLASAYVYPNPVRPNFNIVDQKVKIKDISENVNIKITDIEGNLVAEAQTRTNQRYNGYNLEIDGGTAYWNGKNLANNVVASGVYLVMLSDLDTYETKVLKIMVIR